VRLLLEPPTDSNADLDSNADDDADSHAELVQGEPDKVVRLGGTELITDGRSTVTTGALVKIR
jgi:hypothetical protein